MAEQHPAWQRVGTRAEIEAGELRRVRVGSYIVGLHVFQGELFALDDECPHASAPLSAGCIDADGNLVCPLHGWRYQLRTGCGAGGWEGDLARFAVREMDGAVWVSALPLDAVTDASAGSRET